MQELIKVSLRQKAIFIPAADQKHAPMVLHQTTADLIEDLAKVGFIPSEALLQALNHISVEQQCMIRKVVKEIFGLEKNWTPLVKGWNRPTGESFADHILTFFANLFQMGGTRLPCGHIIPPDTFPLERYNGCPFCGTPFQFGEIENYKQGTILTVLELWSEKEAESFLLSLLDSRTALDATQMDSLKILLAVFPLPEVTIRMKETVMAVVDVLVSQEKYGEAQKFFTSPADILRYLWYKHTGFLRVITPKEIVSRSSKNNRHLFPTLDQSASAKIISAAGLKLKYNRRQARMVAGWLNALPMEVDKICELMHPKRGMWVRFIRALRLAEYSKRPGYEKLNAVMDAFYNQAYTIWQGQVDQYRMRYDAESTFKLLKQRPGLFARSLFANMLWFGPDKAVEAFAEVIDKVPARLVLTLNMYAENYFDKNNSRVVKPVGGVSKQVAANHLLNYYDNDQLEMMRAAIKALGIQAMELRFAQIPTESRSIFIDPELFNIPVAIGDRSETIQDLPAALMGTRFAIEGNTIRLFMQWGQGLKAQHLDMDLSCQVSYNDRTDYCSYSSLVIKGCKHSGDIRSIPNMVGTAEYIDLDLEVLSKAGAQYVVFTCNAYSNGSITPGLVVGWMNSANPMKISATTGVAYDPSCVQHQVRITKGLLKGLVFGVLDIEKREITWLEMPFHGQLVQNMNARQVSAFIRKLKAKLTIGQLLQVKANAQGLQEMQTPQADEVYTRAWAMDTAGVTELLVD